MSDSRPVTPLTAPVDATVAVPGSKSHTNRALACAALADGRSVLSGVLVADDTDAMRDAIGALGASVRAAGTTLEVDGAGPRLGARPASVDARLSGTTSRFVLALAALGRAPVEIDGAPPLRARPMGPSLEALRSLGASVTEQGSGGRLPVTITGPARGGAVAVEGSASSQFTSGLLLAGPCLRDGLDLTMTGTIVSRPYLDLTVSVMTDFGAIIDQTDADRYRIEPTGYRPGEHAIEPDASAASYFFAAAALTGGRVTVDGLGHRARQGDVAFVDVLERMGATVERSDASITVRGPAQLRGVEVDMSDISDTAQTLAVLAPFADSPTRLTGIGFIRHKETDRIGAVVTELRRCGVDAVEEPDGLLIRPGTPRPATIETYDDHRMAMSFALIGLMVPGIRIADPGCVAKTFPGFWETLDRLG